MPHRSMARTTAFEVVDFGSNPNAAAMPERAKKCSRGRNALWDSITYGGGAEYIICGVK